MIHYITCSLATAAAALFVAACTDTALDPIVLDRGDDVVFTTDVQPYVGFGCGSLDCHGDGGRALRLFAKHGLRLSVELRGLEPSSEEVAANLDAFAALSSADPARDIALLKPLAVTAGGMAHEGGQVWTTTESDGYQCVFAFLSGASNSTACAAAFDELGVDP